MARRVADAGVHHGDFGPNNILLDPATFTVTAVLDWERAGPRPDPVDDLAWCEWIVRIHHPGDAAAVHRGPTGMPRCWPNAARCSPCAAGSDRTTRVSGAGSACSPTPPGGGLWSRTEGT
jgi:Phosphotransferase enzyme family